MKNKCTTPRTIYRVQVPAVQSATLYWGQRISLIVWPRFSVSTAAFHSDKLGWTEGSKALVIILLLRVWPTGSGQGLEVRTCFRVVIGCENIIIAITLLCVCLSAVLFVSLQQYCIYTASHIYIYRSWCTSLARLLSDRTIFDNTTTRTSAGSRRHQLDYSLSLRVGRWTIFPLHLV